MKRALIVSVPLAALVLFVAVGAALAPQSASSNSPTQSRILAHKLAVELGREPAVGKEMRLSSGVTYALLDSAGVLNQRAAKNAGAMKALNSDDHGRNISRPNTEGCQKVRHGHGMTNTRVNQDCSLRRQAEEMIQLNPLDERNMIAGQNDSRVGFNHCGYDWTFDGGDQWGDQVPPFYQFVQLDGHTADACSDPTGAWDTHGNAYIGGVLFDLNSGANSVIAMKSNTGNGGAFYHSPNPAGGYQEYRDTPVGVIANDDGNDFANDKELMTTDLWTSSPKRDNVYMTWTRFNAAGHSPIYFSQSTDGAATWSAPALISGSAGDICTPGPACEDDQGSDPVVGPDGTIYVAFANGNIPGAGIEQVLFVKCPASADCSNEASWTPPVRIDTMNGASPVGPDPTSGCPGGRNCLPPNGYRMGPDTSITVSVDRNSKLYVTYSDFRNGRAPCTGPASTATPPCDNDVFYASSADGGATWSAPHNITPRSHFGENAQWQPWSEVTKDGHRLWVGYYDRRYGNCEFSGCNDITAAEIRNPSSDHPSYDYTRVTTSSMPNLVPGNNPIQAGFLGDYMWVDTDSHGDAHIVWADTRPIRGDAPEEDVYYAEVNRDGGH